MWLKFGNGMSVAIASVALLCAFAAYAEKITLTIDPCMPQLQTQVFQVETGEWSEWILWPADDAIEGYRLDGWSSTGSYSSSSKYEGGDRYYRFRCSDDCTIRLSWQWKDTETHYSYDKTTGYSWAFKTLSPMEAQIIGLVNKTDGVLRIPNVVTDNESGQSYAIVEVGGGSWWSVHDDGYFALSELTAITAVVFSPSVRIVREGVFGGCKNLATITWSTGLKEIGEYAFSGTALKEVILPDSLTDCAPSAFSDCPELNKLVFQSRYIHFIGDIYLSNCPKLKTLTLPKEVAYYYEDEYVGLRFIDLPALESLDVPEGVEDVAIARCAELAAVNLPVTLATISSMGDWEIGYCAAAFYGCWKLEKVVCHGDVPEGEELGDLFMWANSIYYPMEFGDHWRKVLRNSGYGGVSGSFAAVDSAKMLQMVVEAPKYATEEVPDFGPYVVGIEGTQVDSSLAGFSMISVPAGLTWNEKSGTLSGTAKKAGEFEVTMSDGVSSFSATIQVDPSPKGIGEGSRFHELIPGEKVEIDTGLDVGYKAVGLPTGLKYDAKTGKITGAATKPGEYAVKFTKSGAETEEMTIIVTAIPTLKVAMEGDVDGCKVTGAGAYLVGKKVTLKVTTKKGTAFLGYYKGEEPWPNASDYKKTSLSYEMTRDDVSVVAKFEKEKMSVGCTGLEGYFVAGVAGSAEGIPLQIETQSGVKSVKVTKLPAGMKYDSKTRLITGAPTKAENPTVVIEVTAVSGAVEKKEIPVRVIAPIEKAVGLFSGFATKDSLQDFNRVGTILLTTTAAGKLTAKVVTKKGSLSFSASSWDGIRDSQDQNDGVYFVTMKTKKGEELKLELDTRADVGIGANQLTGWLKGVDAEDLRIGAQHVVFGQPWYFMVSGDETQGWKLSYTADKKAAALTVTFKADGSVTIAGKLGTYKVSASGYANVSDLPSELLRADFVVAVKVGSQNRMLNVNTDLRFDRTYASDEAGEAAFAE